MSELMTLLSGSIGLLAAIFGLAASVITWLVNRRQPPASMQSQLGAQIAQRPAAFDATSRSGAVAVPVGAAVGAAALDHALHTRRTPNGGGPPTPHAPTQAQAADATDEVVDVVDGVADWM